MHPQIRKVCVLGKEVCLHVKFSQYIFIVILRLMKIKGHL